MTNGLIKVKVCIYTPHVYAKDVFINLMFPALPRIGDYISTSIEMEQSLIASALQDRETLEKFRYWIFGDILSIDCCKYVKEIDWHPAKDNITMEPYIFLADPEMDNDRKPERKEITEEDYKVIKENTYKAYSITNAKILLDKLFLRNA